MVVTTAPLKALPAFVVTPQRDSASGGVDVLPAHALGHGLFHAIANGGAALSGGGRSIFLRRPEKKCTERSKVSAALSQFLSINILAQGKVILSLKQLSPVADVP